jgi:hypothetical protein
MTAVALLGGSASTPALAQAVRGFDPVAILAQGG